MIEIPVKEWVGISAFYENDLCLQVPFKTATHLMVGETSEQEWYAEMRTIKEPNFSYKNTFAGLENFLSKLVIYPFLFLAMLILPIGYFFYNITFLFTFDFDGLFASIES